MLKSTSLDLCVRCLSIVHLEFVIKTYSGLRVSWILANKPLMKCLKELMIFEYFEQNGKVPVTLYHQWSTHGARGSVSKNYYWKGQLVTDIQAD